MKYGKVFLASAHNTRKKIPLLTTSQVKHLVNASKRILLIMVKIEASSEVNLMLKVVCNNYFRLLNACKREE